MSGRREWNKQRTREALERVAFELFLDRGYDETTVADVAAAAHVSERTYFRYFTSKEDVVFCRLEVDLQHLTDALESVPRPPAPSWREVAAALQTFASSYEDQREITRLRSRLVLATPGLASTASLVQSEWRRQLAFTLARRHDRPAIDGDIQLLSGVATAVLTAAMGEWVRDDALKLVTAVQDETARLGVLLRD